MAHEHVLHEKFNLLSCLSHISDPSLSAVILCIILHARSGLFFLTAIQLGKSFCMLTNTKILPQSHHVMFLFHFYVKNMKAVSYFLLVFGIQCNPQIRGKF